VYVYVLACARSYARACARACVRACVACVCRKVKPRGVVIKTHTPPQVRRVAPQQVLPLHPHRLPTPLVLYLRSLTIFLSTPPPLFINQLSCPPTLHTLSHPQVPIVIHVCLHDYTHKTLACIHMKLACILSLPITRAHSLMRPHVDVCRCTNW